MTGLKDLPPLILRDRHHLSSQQVNSLLGRVVFQENPDETIRELEKVKEFLQVTDAMRSGKIDFLPLKGPVLSYRIYGDPVIRDYRDLDILVDVQSIGRINSILKGFGYIPDPTVWPESIKIQRKFIRHFNHISFFNPDKAICFEIHWRLIRTPAINLLQLDEMINQNQLILDFAGRSFRVLSTELELLFLIIHGGLHFWRRLKWMLDINKFLNTQKVDWARFAKLADDLRANRMVALCKEIYKVCFPEGSGIPDNYPVPRSIVDHSLKLILDETEPEPEPRSLKWIINNFYFTLASFPGIKYKTNVIAGFLFVSNHSGRIASYKRVPFRNEISFSYQKNSKIVGF
jgi:hypothetical protein